MDAKKSSCPRILTFRIRVYGLIVILFTFSFPIIVLGCSNSNESAEVQGQHNIGDKNGYVIDLVSDESGSLYIIGRINPWAQLETQTENNSFHSSNHATSVDEFLPFFAVYDSNNEMVTFRSMDELFTRNELIDARIAVSDETTVYIAATTANKGGQIVNSSMINNDILVSRLYTGGNVAWKTYWGRDFDDVISDMAVDQNGNVYVIGYSYAVGQTVTSGTQQIIRGMPNAFLIKVSPMGDIEWERVWGDFDTTSYGYGISFNAENQLYICGSFNGTIFGEPELQNAEINSSGDMDCFIMQLNQSGDCIWIKSLGGTGNDDAFDIECDKDGNLVICGIFSNNFTLDTPGGQVALASKGRTDAFLCKMNSGGIIQWINTWGSTERDFSAELVIDDSSNIFVSGYVGAICDYDVGPDVVSGDHQEFIIKYLKDGVFSNVFAESTGNQIHSIACSGDGIVAVGFEFIENGSIYVERVNSKYQEASTADALALELHFEYYDLDGPI